MRHFLWLLTLPLTFVAVVFGIANRDPVTLDFWPLPLFLDIPLVALIFGCIVAGFFAGAATLWISGGKRRRQARADRREAAELKREVQRLRQRHIEQTGEAGGETPTPVPSTDIRRLPAA